MALTLLYRGALSSCNYACAYCPFAKQQDGSERLEQDRRDLERFVGWVQGRDEPTAVQFVPWGEALIHRWYQEALATLSHLPAVTRVAIQTNLSVPLGFLERCNPERLGIWASYHPGWTSRLRFLDSCHRLERLGVRFSVGMVGLREHLDEIETLRAALPQQVYLWVNAYKRQPDDYTAEEIARIQAVDPLFHLNLRPQPSLGRRCRAGHSVIAVAGDGSARRCLFVDEALGNIYRPGFAPLPEVQPCPAETCRCHLGYVHLEHLALDKLFGEGLLERALERPLGCSTFGG